MSYATPAEVKSLFRNFSGGSNPAVTDTEIQLFLDNASEIIDAKIGTLYTLPITEGAHPKSYKILKQLNMFQAACIVDDILNDYSEADKKPMWCKKSETLLNSLVPPREKNNCRQRVPTMILPDAPYVGTETQRNKMSVMPTSGTIFKKGGNNW